VPEVSSLGFESRMLRKDVAPRRVSGSLLVDICCGVAPRVMQTLLRERAPVADHVEAEVSSGRRSQRGAGGEHERPAMTCRTQDAGRTSHLRADRVAPGRRLRWLVELSPAERQPLSNEDGPVWAT
jgi:hypothetical protein